MAGYINSNLTSNEKIIKRAKVSWWSQWVMILLGISSMTIGVFLYKEYGILTLAAHGLGLIFIMNAMIRMMTIELAITNKRVIAKTGFISRDTTELRIDRVSGLVVTQTVMGRILNYGTVIVSGTGNIKTPITFIKAPIAFRKALNEFLEDPSQFD